MPIGNVLMMPNDYPTPPDEPWEDEEAFCEWCESMYRVEDGCECPEAVELALRFEEWQKEKEEARK